VGAREELIEANGAFAAGFDKGDLEIPPAKPVVVLTCIDARIDPAKALGLEIGDAHVIRNAGGRATDDAIRSLLISSWLLGTREYLVIHHTDCGMTKFTDDVLVGMVKENTGRDVSDREFLSFSDLDQSVRDDVERIRAERDLLPDGVSVSGHVYDVRTGSIREVAPAS
jgi:carbonic anhydrase